MSSGAIKVEVQMWQLMLYKTLTEKSDWPIFFSAKTYLKTPVVVCQGFNESATEFRDPPSHTRIFPFGKLEQIWGLPSHYGLITPFRVLQGFPEMMRTSPGEREESLGKGGKFLIWRTPVDHYRILMTMIFIPVLIKKINYYYIHTRLFTLIMIHHDISRYYEDHIVI